jgi:hypothetical protein
MIVGVFTVACVTPPPDWNKVIGNNHRPPFITPPPPPKTTNELVVYLDTSASMAGYVTRDGQSIFGKVLRELRYATGTFSGSDVKVQVRRVASDVGPALSDMELTIASQDQGVYRGGETNLAGAISTFRSPASTPKPANDRVRISASASDPPPEVEAVPRFHVLVTDGVQSTKQGSATHDCTAGSDQFCVRQKIGELISNNW